MGAEHARMRPQATARVFGGVVAVLCGGIGVAWLTRHVARDGAPLDPARAMVSELMTRLQASHRRSASPILETLATVLRDTGSHLTPEEVAVIASHAHACEPERRLVAGEGDGWSWITKPTARDPEVAGTLVLAIGAPAAAERRAAVARLSRFIGTAYDDSVFAAEGLRALRGDAAEWALATCLTDLGPWLRDRAPDATDAAGAPLPADCVAEELWRLVEDLSHRDGRLAGLVLRGLRSPYPPARDMAVDTLLALEVDGPGIRDRLRALLDDPDPAEASRAAGALAAMGATGEWALTDAIRVVRRLAPERDWSKDLGPHTKLRTVLRGWGTWPPPREVAGLARAAGVAAGSPDSDVRALAGRLQAALVARPAPR